MTAKTGVEPASFSITGKTAMAPGAALDMTEPINRVGALLLHARAVPDRICDGPATSTSKAAIRVWRIGASTMYAWFFYYEDPLPIICDELRKLYNNFMKSGVPI